MVANEEGGVGGSQLQLKLLFLRVKDSECSKIHKICILEGVRFIYIISENKSISVTGVRGVG